MSFQAVQAMTPEDLIHWNNLSNPEDQSSESQNPTTQQRKSNQESSESDLEADTETDSDDGGEQRESEFSFNPFI